MNANSPALSATRTASGVTYIFYWNKSNEIIYYKGGDEGPYGEYTITVKIDGVSTTVSGENTALTSTLFSGEEVKLRRLN